MSIHNEVTNTTPKRHALIIVWLVFALSTASSPVFASLIWDFSVTGSDASGSGSIEFKTPSGGTADDVAAFSYTGSVYGHDFAAGLDDLPGPMTFWVIDEITWELLTIGITTARVDTGTPGVQAALQVGASSARSAARTVCISSLTLCDGADVGVALGPTVFTPRHVPEPTTLALLSLGLVGLGFTRRKTKA